MGNSPAPFKQVDVTRAVKGAKAAGISVGRIEIDRNGKIVVVAESAISEDKNDWD